MIQQRSRIPAIMMLLALSAFAVGMFFARRGHAHVALNARLIELEAAVAKPEAKKETWLAYGQALQQDKQYPKAIVAFDQALKMDPYNRDARLGCAFCRATVKDADKFYTFMHETIQVDPKLAKAMFESRPEVAAYLSEGRFKALQQDAIAGSMD